MNNNETSKELRTVNGGDLVCAAPKDTLTELMDIAEMVLLNKTAEELTKLMEKLGC